MKNPNYYNTFIHVAPDCRLEKAKIPQLRNDKKTVALIEYELLNGEPYVFTQADVLFQTHLIRRFDEDKPYEGKVAALRNAFFSEFHACLRCSPLAKTHGWGLHFNEEGKIRLIACESPRYAELAEDASITQLYAMRSKR